MNRLQATLVLIVALMLSACTSMGASISSTLSGSDLPTLRLHRQNALEEMAAEKQTLDNLVSSGVVVPGSQAHLAQVNRACQRYLDTFLPVVDEWYVYHNSCYSKMNHPDASADTRSEWSAELSEVRKELALMVQDVVQFNLQCEQNQSSSAQVGYTWRLTAPKTPNVPSELYVARALEQVPGFQNAAPAQFVPAPPPAQAQIPPQPGQPVPAVHSGSPANPNG